jgi:hypothetical protein
MIGLDPDVVVREFLEVYPDPGDVYVTTTAAAAAAEQAAARNAAPSVRLRTIVDSAIESLTKLRRPAAYDEPAASVAPPRQETTLSDSVVTVPEPIPVSDEAIEQTNGRDGKSRTPDEPVTSMPSVEVGRAEPPSGSGGDSVEVDRAAADAIAAGIQSSYDSNLEVIARLCTELGRVVERSEVQLLLQDSARALSATGLIVWLWDEAPAALRPALVHGYSDKVLAQLPPVTRDADNATAAAFRDANLCEVAGSAHTSGALVVPMLVADGCAGVLAIELQQGIQPTRTLRAVATVLAAALAQLVHRSEEGARERLETAAAPIAQLGPPVRPAKVRR